MVSYRCAGDPSADHYEIAHPRSLTLLASSATNTVWFETGDEGRWTSASDDAILHLMQNIRRNTAPVGQSAELDAFDLAILNLVQEDNQLNSHQIGAQVALSPSAVQRRLRRLREAGVIIADVSLIAPAVAGNRVTIIVEVSLEREQLQQRQEFERSVRNLPEVVQCYYVTGDSDYVLILNMKNMEEYSAFTDEIFSSNPNIKQFHTAVVMKPIKFTTRVSL